MVWKNSGAVRLLGVMVSVLIVCATADVEAVPSYDAMVRATGRVGGLAGGDSYDNAESGSPTSMFVSGVAAGTQGEGANSIAQIDWASGVIKVQAHVDNAYHAVATDWSEPHADGRLAVNEVLQVTIAAGTYPDGASFDLPYDIEGWINVSQTGQDPAATNIGAALVDWTFDLDGVNATDKFVVWTDGPTTKNYHESGVLSRLLVSPGGIVPSEVTASLSLYVWLQAAAGSDRLHYNIVSDSDFAHTGSFGVPQVSAGVTWTSQSGVFLTNVGLVPEPGSAALMLLGAVGMIRKRRRA